MTLLKVTTASQTWHFFLTCSITATYRSALSYGIPTWHDGRCMRGIIICSCSLRWPWPCCKVTVGRQMHNDQRWIISTTNQALSIKLAATVGRPFVNVTLTLKTVIWFDHRFNSFSPSTTFIALPSKPSSLQLSHTQHIRALRTKLHRCVSITLWPIRSKIEAAALRCSEEQAWEAGWYVYNMRP